MTEFNYFKILSKDDKELIHSSVIRYLLQENVFFKENLFNIFKEEIDPEQIYLEKSYRWNRIDIEAHSIDNESILVIENKFKSFPYKEQLDKYDEIYKKNYPTKKVYKYLICFEPEIINFNQSEWQIISYKKIVEVINDYLKFNKKLSIEKSIFLKHYKKCLLEYFKSYDLIKNNLKELFSNYEDKKNKFWLRLIMSAIAIKLLETNGDFKKIETDKGSTKIPLINIYIDHEKWYPIKDIKFLIQFQGNKIKFYIHYNKKEFNRAIELCDNIILNMKKEKLLKGEFRVLPKKDRKNKKDTGSFYLYREDITKVIADNFTLDVIVKYIITFYDKINNIIKKY